MSPREFQRLSPGARQRLYATWIDALRGPEGALPEEIVAALPQEPRHREARHAWSLPPFAAYPAKRLPFIAFLPFEEARREAGPFALQPDAELRALANAKIIGVGRYEPSRLPAILDYRRTKKKRTGPGAAGDDGRSRNCRRRAGARTSAGDRIRHRRRVGGARLLGPHHDDATRL